MTETTNPLADRDVRQREIVPAQKLAECYVMVIGVGAIGRQVALQLAAVGVSRMMLMDHDIVGVENLAPQGYWPRDLGLPKVRATAELCRCIHPQIEVDARAERFRRSSVRELPQITEKLVVFCCVDSMESRKLIWESLRGQVSLFIDGRMSAEVLRVLAAGNPVSDTHYSSTLFSDETAFRGSCTAKSTIYAASIAAGLMVGQFTLRWLREMPVDEDLMLNLLSSEMAMPSMSG